MLESLKISFKSSIEIIYGKALINLYIYWAFLQGKKINAKPKSIYYVSEARDQFYNNQSFPI